MLAPQFRLAPAAVIIVLVPVSRSQQTKVWLVKRQTSGLRRYPLLHTVLHHRQCSPLQENTMKTFLILLASLLIGPTATPRRNSPGCLL